MKISLTGGLVMIFALISQFHIYLLFLGDRLANTVVNLKVLVGAGEGPCRVANLCFKL